MPDRLSALLQRFVLRSRLVMGGVLHHELALQPQAGVGHLHLLRRGPLRLTGPHGQHQLLVEPSLFFLPRPVPHQVAATAPEGPAPTISTSVCSMRRCGISVPWGR